MEENTPIKSSRLLSIDALRGFDMMFIIGVAAIISSFCGLFPGGENSWLATQMTHVEWDGFRHHDTIFALFLFISGMTFPFSLAKKEAKGMGKWQISLEIVKRGAILVLLGLIYQGLLQFNFSTQRIPSVLARIGMAWACAAFIYYFCGKKTQWGIAAGILIGYYLLIRFTLAPDAAPGTDPFSIEGNIAYYVDRTLIPNHIYTKLGDPEGIVGLIPAIVTALLGMFTGRYVKDSPDSGDRKTVKMLAAGVIMLVIGLVWSHWFPIIKSIWSSTFVLVAAAYSVIMFAIFYWLIDVKGWRKGVLFFQVIGMNSITVYIGQRILGVSHISNFFFGGIINSLPAAAGEFVANLGYFTVVWLILYFLYKKNVFLKV